jgi:hypothetical protein
LLHAKQDKEGENCGKRGQKQGYGMVSDARIIGVDGPDSFGCGMEYPVVVEPAGLTGLRGFIPCVTGGIAGILTGNNGIFLFRIRNVIRCISRRISWKKSSNNLLFKYRKSF